MLIVYVWLSWRGSSAYAVVIMAAMENKEIIAYAIIWRIGITSFALYNDGNFQMFLWRSKLGCVRKFGISELLSTP